MQQVRKEKLGWQGGVLLKTEIHLQKIKTTKTIRSFKSTLKLKHTLFKPIHVVSLSPVTKLLQNRSVRLKTLKT